MRSKIATCAVKFDDHLIQGTRREPSSNTPEQFGKGGFKGPSELLDVNQPEVALAPFNPSNVSPVEHIEIGKLLLRHPQGTGQAYNRWQTGVCSNGLVTHPPPSPPWATVPVPQDLHSANRV